MNINFNFVTLHKIIKMEEKEREEVPEKITPIEPEVKPSNPAPKPPEIR